MNITGAERKIYSFCAKNNIAFEWQEMPHDGRRAVIESPDRVNHAVILSMARRIKGIIVSDWWCAGGEWEGRIYLQDAEDAQRIRDIQVAEKERSENWWRVNHEARLAGMDFSEAAKYAERLFPTPAAM